MKLQCNTGYNTALDKVAQVLKLIQGYAGLRDVVVIDKEMPSRREWNWIRTNEVTVNVIAMPGMAGNLDPLAPYFSNIRHLALNSYSCSDISLVDEMPALESLSVEGRVTKIPELTRLQHLSSYSGPLKGFEMVFEMKSVTKIDVDVSRQKVPTVGDWVTSLTLSSASRLERLDILRSAASLEYFALHQARSVDVSDIALVGRLSEIEFAHCALITGAQSLASLAELRKLWLEDCGRIEPEDSLLMLQAQVSIIGRVPISRSLAERAGSNWSFPPYFTRGV